MTFFYDLVTNYYLMSAIASWMIAQILKAITGVFKIQDFSWRAFFFGTGGMPSSHTATVVGLCTACVIRDGVGSPLVAISGVLAMVVIIDATGVRLETGKQAHALNILLEEQYKGEDAELGFTKFKELIGHTPLQVFFGAVTGFVVTVLMSFIPVFNA